MGGMLAGVGWSSAAGTAEAVKEAVGAARAGLGGGRAAVAYVTCTVEHDAATVARAVLEAVPGAALHGITTSLGGLTSRGVLAGSRGALGILLLGGDAGYSTGHAVLGGDAREAGRRAAMMLRDSGRGPVKTVLFNASPGAEEDILLGVADVLPGVPAWGGSAADHAIAGEWKVITGSGVHGAAVTLVGMHDGTRAGGAFVAPYKATGRTARVTAARDRRLAALDGKPAAHVLNTWVGPSLDGAVKNGGNILAQTSLHPVGVRAAHAAHEHYVAIHPANIHAATGEVDLFARVTTGQELCELSSTEDALVHAWDTMVADALSAGGMSRGDVKAALVIHCAGCAGALGPRVDEAMKLLGARLGDVPVFGLCTFGEQGHVPGVGNLHQDLSLGLLLLG